MNTITLRTIKQEDNKSLASIIRTVFEEYDTARPGTVYFDPTTDDLYSLFQTPRSVCWVAEVDGQLAGCAGIFPTPGLPDGCCEFAKFYLASFARGKGVGRKLMEQCLNTAKELGYKQVYLESLPEFNSAISLYEKLGFQPLNAPLGNSGHFGCNIWMLKNL
ncbi:GNAT family N-acetyltransferase [Chitinophagaceae bacterium LB-8]|uniref:GNAT family N-acetyltransferase n=1 Tax=Paraflavisolibacter caeni TaxID=2982496 RepID=A0A9X2XRR6_9BACT|nr:GNAT family N-acetyltransferase [Paraflavisolibacter caeni]MCU7547594.1 GNAT family N-acetyltransferase [Paraflavisolibacter caeni]